MKPFAFKHGADPWPPDVSILHVYAVPDLTRDTALATLVRDSQEALRDFPVTPVRPEWLHVTIDQVTGALGGSVTMKQREDLVAALATELATAEPLTVAGSAATQPLRRVPPPALGCSRI